jgi:hypothetical protein
MSQQLFNGIAITLKEKAYKFYEHGGEKKRTGVMIEFECCGCGLKHNQLIEKTAEDDELKLTFWETKTDKKENPDG